MESLCLELKLKGRLTLKVIGMYKASLVKMKDFNDKTGIFFK
jgi:hypothetical protein